MLMQAETDPLYTKCASYIETHQRVCCAEAVKTPVFWCTISASAH